MPDESPLYRLILERWDDAAPYGQANWWEFHLSQSDLGEHAPHLAEFTAQRPDLQVRPEETDPQEYRQFVVEQYVEWLTQLGIDQGAYGQQYLQYEQGGGQGAYGQQYLQYEQGGGQGAYGQQYPQYDQGAYGQQYLQYEQGGGQGAYGQQYPQYDQGAYGQQYPQYDQGAYGQQYPQYEQGKGQEPQGEGGQEGAPALPDEPPTTEDLPSADPAAIQQLTVALAAFTGQIEQGAAVTQEQVQLMQSYGLTLEVDIDDLPLPAAPSSA